MFDCSHNTRFMIACSVTAEWYFRSSLDRYVWIFGMLCAWVHPKVLVCNASLDPRLVHHPAPRACRRSAASQRQLVASRRILPACHRAGGHSIGALSAGQGLGLDPSA